MEGSEPVTYLDLPEEERSAYRQLVALASKVGVDHFPSRESLVGLITTDATLNRLLEAGLLVEEDGSIAFAAGVL